MKRPCRPQVVWLGRQVPEQVPCELGRRGMAIVTKTPVALNPNAAETRAVLLPLETDPQAFRKTLSHAVPSINAGVLVAVVIQTEAERGDANLLASQATEEIENNVPTLTVARPHELAERCADHDPGRAVNPDLRIDDLEHCVTNSQAVLIRRAFSNFHRVEVHRLSGGRSDASGVWRVSAYDQQDWGCEPFAVKAGPRRRIEEEVAMTLNNVAEYVPFPHRPPVVPERCVAGSREALMVSMFVERVTRLEEYLLLGSPSLAIASLFDGPLRRWRQNRHTGEAVQLATEYVQCGVLPKTGRVSELNDAFARARVIDNTVPEPADLLRHLTSLPNSPVHFCFPHGDLHARNIFVRRDSVDVILIDFAAAKNPSPAARDLANLDVAIAFDVADKAGVFLAEDEIRALYTPPLLPAPLLGSGDGRTEAIAQLRMHASGEGISPGEYQLTIACYMLKFARFRVPADEANPEAVRALKGLAYELASRLTPYRAS